MGGGWQRGAGHGQELTRTSVSLPRCLQPRQVCQWRHAVDGARGNGERHVWVGADAGSLIYLASESGALFNILTRVILRSGRAPLVGRENLTFHTPFFTGLSGVRSVSTVWTAARFAS